MDLRRLNNSKEGRELIEFLKKEVERLSSTSDIDFSQTNEVIARDAAANNKAALVLKRILKMTEIKEEKEESKKNREYE